MGLADVIIRGVEEGGSAKGPASKHVPMIDKLSRRMLLANPARRRCSRREWSSISAKLRCDMFPWFRDVQRTTKQEQCKHRISNNDSDPNNPSQRGTAGELHLQAAMPGHSNLQQK